MSLGSYIKAVDCPHMIYASAVVRVLKVNIPVVPTTVGFATLVMDTV